MKHESPSSGSSQRAEAGYAVYTPGTLRMYDWAVLRLSNRWFWRCPTSELLRRFQQHVTDNHLDVGVGSGYFLARVRLPGSAPRLALMDANRHCLRAAARRAAYASPELHAADILQPLPHTIAPFRSISLNYVLHCLPGSMSEKGLALARLRELLLPGGILFGATLLGQGVPLGPVARWLMALYNRRGIFSNQQDSLHALDQQLAQHFSQHQLETIGAAAWFVARRDG